MVSSQSVVGPSSGCRAFARSLCFARLAYSHATLALSPGCRSRSARAVRPASLGGQRTALGLPSDSGQGRRNVQPGLGLPREQYRSFGHAGLAVQAAVLRHLTRLPVSQRLKPQSSMPVRFRTNLSASVAQHVCRSFGAQGRRTAVPVSSSKQERAGSHQPPNPSFKRTRLRRSA